MKSNEGIKKIIKDLKENGINETTVMVNNKKYNINELDLNDFTQVSSERIEDFIKRVNPLDDNDLSYKIGLEVTKLLNEK